MAIINKFLSDTDRSLYTSPEKEAWSKEVSELNDLDEAVAKLIDFRTKNIGIARETYELDFDCIWREAKLEERVAELKSAKFSGKSLLDTCTCGTLADTVLKEWLGKNEAAKDDLSALEGIMIQYRREFKPPIMPVNHWLKGDTDLSSRLLKRRANYTASMSVAELREMRGVRVVV